MNVKILVQPLNSNQEKERRRMSQQSFFQIMRNSCLNQSMHEMLAGLTQLYLLKIRKIFSQMISNSLNFLEKIRVNLFC